MQHEPKPQHVRYPLRRLGGLTTLGNAREDLLTVLVEVKLGDDAVGGGDAEGNGLAVGLLANDTLDVDDVLQTVDGGDLALTALVGATDNGDLVVLAEGDGADLLDGVLLTFSFPSHGWLSVRPVCPILEKTSKTLSGQTQIENRFGKTYVVLLTELLGEGSGHANAALGGGGREVSLAGLAPRRGETWIHRSVLVNWRKSVEKRRARV